ncbi:MAG: RNA pseudouridine synthase [Sphaerochaetaceae bacterium]|nr:RNA pseudouridine synthase [Sphaerochaetaceae bacterium]
MNVSVQDVGLDALEPVIIAEEPSFLVVDKPAGLPTVPLKQDPPGKPTLLGEVAKEYPEILSVQDQRPWEGGMIHRLDTATSGLVVIARTPMAWMLLRASQRAGLYTKDYKAYSAGVNEALSSLEGFPAYPYDDPARLGGCVVRIGCLFRPWGDGRKAVRPVCKDASETLLKKASPTWYMTEVCYMGDDEVDGRSCKVFSCRINAGFRHQIRCQLAWAGWPLTGDALYGGVPSCRLGLRAYSIRFPHPENAGAVEFRVE